MRDIKKRAMGKQEVFYLPCMLSFMVKAIKSRTLSKACAGKHRYRGRVALMQRQLMRSSIALLHRRLGTMASHGDGEGGQLRQWGKTSN